jgi:hypothetical protein
MMRGGEAMADQDPQINISQVKVAGVGGFGLVVIVAAMALDMPVVRAFLIAGIAGGLIGAVLMGAYRRWFGRTPAGPGSIFMLDESRAGTCPVTNPDNGSGQAYRDLRPARRCSLPALS